MKVLLVDDEHDIRRIAYLSLTRVGGMEVIEAADAETALTRAASEQPDVILLDVMMPGRDGPATLAALQAAPETRHLPVIFLTARSSSDDVQQLLALGARGVLQKPFDPLTLAAELRRILAG